ncbi:hypothetical protein FACS189426_20410 [Bacteroidia bacterium]|nr:hypothetical protein FACS189426_20410 [Bacteroidia bacterium]
MSNKDEEIKFRCTSFEKSIIKQKAFQTGKTVSEYCRIQSIRGKVVSKPKLTEEEKLFFRLLQTHNSNFTKIGNYIKNKAPELIPEIILHLENMKKLYTKFFPE